MNDKHDISVLNGLITTTLDSLKGFEDAADEAKSTRFADLFAGLAHDHRQVVGSLQAEVRGISGEPEDSSGFPGAAKYTLMKFKQAFTGKSDKAIIDEVERGEDHVTAKFEIALKDIDLQPATRDIIRDASTSVKAGHDQISALKHSLV